LYSTGVSENFSGESTSGTLPGALRQLDFMLRA
jgi:hypothetical protein